MRRVLVAIAVVGALMGAGATAVTAVQQRPSSPAWSHVVAPGDTLWGLAEAASPTKDPRETVDRLISANHLGRPTIRPGQRLILPRS